MMLSPTAIDPAVVQAIEAGAVVAFSLSGGKDSTAAMQGATAVLDALGHPHELRIAIHADLGRAEWQSTPATVASVARRFNLPLIVVRHGKHDMVSRWEARFEEGKRRYAALEVFNLIGPWSSASLRFCTSELKVQVLGRKLQQMFPGRQVISVVGIRREESLTRSLAPISKPEPRWSRRDGFRRHLLEFDVRCDHPVDLHRTHRGAARPAGNPLGAAAQPALIFSAGIRV